MPNDICTTIHERKKKALTQLATIAKRSPTSEHSDYKIVVPEHVETKSLIQWIQWIFKVGQSCTWQCNHGSLRTLAGMFQQLSFWWSFFAFVGYILLVCQKIVTLWLRVCSLRGLSSLQRWSQEQFLEKSQRCVCGWWIADLCVERGCASMVPQALGPFSA